MAAGQDEIIKLRDAGFSTEEIGQWSGERRRTLSAAGFSEVEIDEYFGRKRFNPEPLRQYMQENLSAPAVGEDGKPQPKPASGFVEALEAGFQMSISGLLAREKMPDKALAQDNTFLERMAYNVGTVAGDVPFMVGGYLLGAGAGAPTGPGALVTGAGGALALPAGLREVITHAYEKGEVGSVGEFFSLASDAVIETTKGWVLGAGTAGAGVAAKAVLPAAAPAVVSVAVPTAAEIGTMVALGAALEGHVPKAQDFVDAAVLIGGLKASGAVASKLRRIYARTGVPPQEAARQAGNDPVLKQELLSRDVEMPRAFERLAEQPDPSGRVEPKVDPKMLETAKVLGEVGRVEPTMIPLPAPKPRIDDRAALVKAVMEVESGGQRFGADGKLLTSPKGAQGEMQVMPDTARNPGFGVEPARNSSPEELARVGRDYFAAMRQRYKGDVEKALAAYNGGPGAVDAAVERAAAAGNPGNWLALMPKETRQYVPKVLAKYNSLAGTGGAAGGGAGGGAGGAGGGRPPSGSGAGGGGQPAIPQGPSANPQAAVLARIVPGETKGRELTWDRAYTAAVDDLHPIKQFEKALAGKKVDTPDSPYDLARLTRGAYGKADQFLEHGTFEFNSLRNVGKPLKKVLEPVKNDLDGLRAYAVASRAVELDARGIQTGVPLADARAVVATGKTKYGQVLAELQEYQNTLVAYLRDAGILSPEAYNAMLAANKDYVPFFRLAGDEFGGPGAAGKGFSTRNPVKNIKGSDKLIVDPIESVIKNTYLYVTLAERNAVGRKMHELVQANPQAAQALGVERVPPPVRPISVSAHETGADMIAQFMQAHGFNVQVAPFITIFRAFRQPTAANEIRFFEKGNPVTLRVPEVVAEAMKGLDHHSFGLLTKIAALPAKGLRAGTVLSPEFMSRNFTRDQMTAFIMSVGNFRPIWDTLSGFGSLMTKDAHYQNWLKSGGANSAFVSIDRQYIQNNIFKLSQETGLMRSAWNVVRSPLELLRVMSETIENSTRLGEFKQVMAGGADARTAGMAAREVTLDFARVGANMRALNMMSAFMNPGIQGIDRIMRAFKEKPVETTTRTLAAVTLPSILLWAVNHDDPRWKDLPQWQKDLFWIVMTDDAIYRIPKPFELGVIFGSLPERVMEAYFTDNPQAFKEFQKSVLEGMTPNYMPTFATPIIEHFGNKSTFTGNPIVPGYIEKLLPEYRYTEYTHEVTKMLGSAIAAFPGMKHADIASPAVIENYWRAWTGGMGMYLLQAADAALAKAGVTPDPVKPAATLADLPIIKAFVVRYPSTQAQSIQDFYDRYYERKQVYDTVLSLAREGNPEAAQKEYALAPGAMANVDGMREALTNLSKMIRLIHKNPEFQPDEKRQLIDSLYMQMILIAREGNEAMNAIDKVVGQGVAERSTR